ncbi:MAG TPA: RNase H family protein [Pyrinomonadaceae bacterium]|nr:RNase H family protein [Pyrinomonadaceae bacterium]
MKEVLIVCDGSSIGNGRGNPRAAAVALLGYQGNWKAVGEFLGEATNQQAEIAAATIGLQSLREPCRVKLLSDSRYVVETMCGRFRRKTNLDWWNRLDEAAKSHKVVWQWVKGHAGDTLQEAVDTAARKIATLGSVDEKLLADAAATAKTAKI